MSLLDMIETAVGDTPYIKDGRTLGRIKRVSYFEPDPKKPNPDPLKNKPSFRLDVEVLKADSPATPPGTYARASVNFRYDLNKDYARVRSILTVAQSSASGEMFSEGKMTAAKVLELTGEEQPLTDALIVIVGKKGQKSDFVTYTAELPTDEDLDGIEL